MQVHFNLVNGSESIREDEGIELSDVDHAEAEALKVIHEMRSEKGAEPRGLGWLATRSIDIQGFTPG
jgi:hypothetical protein